MKCYILLLTMMLSVGSASAASISSWEEAPNFGDAGLAGFSTWALRVETDTDWLLTELDVQLTSGTINHIKSSAFGNPPVPGFVNLGDSGIFNPTAPNDATALGGNLSGGGLAVSSQPDFSESPTNLTVGWFNTRSEDIGSFHIATLTLSDDANGTINGRVISNAPGNDTSSQGYSVEVVDGVIVEIPEPTTMFLAGIGMLCMAGRRRS